MSQSQAVPSLEYRVGDRPVPGYTLVRELGRGAMGVVWLAQTESGFERALKVINLQQRGGKKEYRGLRTIKQRKLLHGNLLTLIDYWLKNHEGRIIPDSDELSDSDSFFAPLHENSSGPLTLGKTTPQSAGATDVGRQPAISGKSSSPVGPAPAPPPRPAATLVSRGTLTGAAGDTDQQASDNTLDFAGRPRAQSPPEAAVRDPAKRPVQLIVAMELGHKTLDDRQKQCHEDRLAGVPPQELLDYMEQAARGLDYLHREGIVHRDIKPANIMLVGDVAKVCDYGLVVTTDADLRATSNAFTPLYASPEAVGEHPLTGQSDQYSLAITYVELRTGHSPYASETAATVYAAKETGKYDLSRIRNSAVRNVLKRALAKSPHDRFGSCSEFIRELEKAEQSRSGTAFVLTAAAAVALVGIGASLTIPAVRQRISRIIAAAEGGADVSKRRDVDPSRPDDPQARDPSQPITPMPQPPPELRKAVEEARALRLAGQFDEAEQKLDELKIDTSSTNPADWLYHLEQLHLELSRQSGAPSAILPAQWDAWKKRLARFEQQARTRPAEQVQSAALKIFTFTHWDVDQLSLELPLADEFAQLARGQEQWNKVLSTADLAQLDAVQKALGQRLLASQQQLPPAWKRRLTDIWPIPTVAQLLIDRARRQIHEGAGEELVAATADLNDFEGQVNWNAWPAERTQLNALYDEIKQSENKLLVESLQRSFTKGEFLDDAKSRQALVGVLQSAGDLSAMPLATLLRLELQMAEQDASGKKYPSEIIAELRGLVQRLTAASESPSRNYLDYAHFLALRAEANNRQGSTKPAALPAQIDSLLQWPEAAVSDWHTSRRKEQAVEVLLWLADTALPIGEKDIVGFSELPRDVLAQAATAAGYLNKCGRMGCDSPYRHGLTALALAAAARQTNRAEPWAQVVAAADQALANWVSVTNPSQQSRLPAIKYVSALAASRFPDQGAAERNRQAISTLITLLQREFRESGTANASVDPRLLENIVLPGLKVPVDESAMPAERSALWVAKGRLIERNPNAQFLAIGGIDPAADADEYAQALLSAHDAFARAEDLHPSVAAAAGCARTLFKLPRETFDWKKYETKLTELVERHRQNAAEEPSLLFADAAVLRRRALRASGRAEQLRLAEAALERFMKVDELTLANDPYAIRGLALCAASDTYLKAAFWTPIAASDEAKSPTAGRTKYSLLSRAVDAARSAATDLNLLLPEEAQIAKGNALEDLSYYCKETERYQEATDAFQEAVKKTGQRRPKAHALTSLGRCQYRWAMDALQINVNPDERLKHLWEAHQTLIDAQEHARKSDPSVEPEASFWLATVRWQSALEGPGNLEMPGNQGRGFRSLSLFELRRGLGDPSRTGAATQEIAERLRLIEQSRQEIVRAAELARAQSPTEWAQYLPTAVYLGKIIAENLPGPSSPVAAPVAAASLFEQVRTQVDRLLAFAADEPGLLTPQERRSLISNLARVGQAQPDWTRQKHGQLYQDYEKAIGEDSDEARFQLVLIRLSRAQIINAPDCTDAEQVASRIASPSLSSRAFGHCQSFKADVLLRPLRDRLYAYIGNPDTNKSLTLSDDGNLQAIQQAYAAALQQLGQTSDPKTIANLNRLVAAPLDEIENGKWQQGLTNLEADALRQTLEETADIRRRVCDVLVARINLHMEKDWPWKDLSKPLPDDEKQAIRLAIACLKPFRFCEARFQVNVIDKDAIAFLRACERRK